MTDIPIRMAIQAVQPQCPECGCLIEHPEATWGGTRIYITPAVKADVLVKATCRCGCVFSARFVETQR